MKKTSLCFFTLFICLAAFSQKNEKITVKKQNQLFFYRLSNDTTGIIIKNVSDKFLIQMSNDYKGVMVFSIQNGSFVKTNQENIYQLIYLQGLKYRAYFPTDDTHSDQFTQRASKNALKYKEELKMEIDGAAAGKTEEITIEVQNSKTEKVLLLNRFFYRAQ